jgi:hypothetical protein
MYFCEACGEQVRPKSDSSIVFAVELLPGGGFGGGQHEVIEGRHVYFHERCYPARSERYKVTPKPKLADAGEGDRDA